MGGCVPRVANINFLRTISIHYQEKEFWEFIKGPPNVNLFSGHVHFPSFYSVRLINDLSPLWLICFFFSVVVVVFFLFFLSLNFFWRFKPLRAIRDSEENSLFTCASFAVRSRIKYSVIGSCFYQTRITKEKDIASFKAVSFKILETFEDYAQSSDKTKARELLPKVTNHFNFWRILFELLSHLKYI